MTATNGETVTLSTATASDYDSLLWTCTSGQSPTFSDATELNPTVTFNEVGVHTLQLAATNTDGTTTDTLTVTVQAVIVDSGYNSSNPPALVAQMVGKNGASMWEYDSADSPSNVRQNGYFTDGVALGMKVGDVVTQIDTVGATVHHMYTVKSLNSDGSVNLSDGTAIN
jgi:PKD repeat protein